MIVGTAGHIDHGKTTLVRALTGVDTDRLKEEKERGMSIELGYAYAPAGNDDILGFIDVPGHERLVHTMAAGASGIDFGLLVVAADDGIMPQTREHLAILSMLGLTQGAIALTKADRVDEQRINQVQAEINREVAGTFLQDAPLFAVNATLSTDAGVSRLRAYLRARAQTMAARSTQGLFRLAVDRVFTLKGHGTVVTGTVHDGLLDLNDDTADLRLMPSGHRVRVRSIHAQNQPSQTARAGQRCALNLAGIGTDAIARGDWVANAHCFTPSQNVDVYVRMLPDAGADLRAWSPLHVHIGASHYLAHGVPLSNASIAPGESGWIQLVFDQSVCAMPGDRYIIRDAQARHTVGGGLVLDANAPQRKRRSPQRLAWLQAVAALLAGGNLNDVLLRAPHGLNEYQLRRLLRKVPDSSQLPQNARWVAPPGNPAQRSLILQENWHTLIEHVRNTLTSFHEHWPDEPGIDPARLRRMALPTLPEPLWTALREQLINEKKLARNGPWLHLPHHSVDLTPTEAELAERLLPLIHAGAFSPPWVRDLSGTVNQSEQTVRQTLLKLFRRGEVYQVVHDLFYHREQITRLAQLIKTKGHDQGVSAGQFRDVTGLGRKRAIQILEFFDRAGYTRRIHDKHVVRNDGAHAWRQLS
jgi:selenocysteine-specific elongation factor